MKLEEKLVFLRKENGLSQLELAELMHVSRQAISRWEVGTAIPSVDNLRFISKLYSVSIDELLDEEVKYPLEKQVNENSAVDDAGSNGNTAEVKQSPKHIRRLEAGLLLLFILGATLLIIYGIITDTYTTSLFTAVTTVLLLLIYLVIRLLLHLFNKAMSSKVEDNK
ncbi:MAG: helix-turn-helix transcriptional regulator [Lachnospiraceae bacterium]|nr:helix-turn-helix transcriptional regulator [Lachnospiraceae bacterium]